MAEIFKFPSPEDKKEKSNNIESDLVHKITQAVEQVAKGQGCEPVYLLEHPSSVWVTFTAFGEHNNRVPLHKDGFDTIARIIGNRFEECSVEIKNLNSDDSYYIEIESTNNK